jgi:hypothetical protein
MLEQTGQSSDLVEIAKRKGDFKRNYGMVLGALLDLRSISAARGHSFLWVGIVVSLISAGLSWALKLARW